ncbi:MAG: hypothetical protein VB013_10185 [Anaerolineaceae bacterium]|nr:hypothetical protein [Anaerolineaceae bacterium]
MDTTLLQKIELRFWDIILPLMTRSQFVRKTVQAAVTFYQNDQLVKKTALVGMIACGGFATGILAFTLRSLIG